MPPMTAPLTVPTPVSRPCSVTGRTDSTVASTTVDMRCASYALTVLGLATTQPVREPAPAMAAIRAICLNIFFLRGMTSQRRQVASR